MISAGVYLRVSSKDGRQDEANQEPDCVRLCTARGWTPVFFRERESGAKDRPEWRRLIEACRRGQIRAVVFWALDRTGRSRIQIAHDIGELSRWRVDVTSVQDPWIDQPVGPLRDLLVQIMAWVAEGERARLIERTKAGVARARAAGKRLGRPRADEAALARGAMLASGALSGGRRMSLRGAAAAVGVGRATLRAYMAKNPPPIPPSKVA